MSPVAETDSIRTRRDELILVCVLRQFAQFAEAEAVEFVGVRVQVGIPVYLDCVKCYEAAFGDVQAVVEGEVFEN